MRLTARSNIEDVLGKLDNIADALSSVVAARAANKLLDQAETAGLRKIGEIYDIGPRTMEQYATVDRATNASPIARITVKGKGFPLYIFQPRQTRQGVSIKIKGRRVVVPHSFLATMPNGHIGVFARGKYGAHFQFGKGTKRRTRPRAQRSELPISELFSFAPADAFSEPRVVDAMDQRVSEQIRGVISQELRFAVR